MARLSKDMKDFLIDTIQGAFKDYKDRHYPDTFGTDADPYRTELNKIREQMKDLKAAGKLDGAALDDILAKHDALLQQWHNAARDAKAIQNLDPYLKKLSRAIKRCGTNEPRF